MRAVFGGALAAFAVMYLVAELTLSRGVPEGVVRIRWSTDPNPARTIQTRLFSELNPGVEVVVDPGSQQKLIVQCATGTGPDVIDLYGIEHMRSCAEAGILLDLTPYAREMGFAPENTYPAIRDGLLVDGKQYRFPCNVWANCVIYNKKVFDDHGVSYPRKGWTYDDFIEIGRRFKTTPSKSGEKHLAVANYYNVWFFQDLLIGCGGRQFTPDGLRSAFDSEEAIRAMRMYHDLMYVHGVLTPPSEAAALSSQGGWGAGGLNWFSAGRAAMIFIGRWYIVQVPNWPNLKGCLGAVQLPRVGERPSAGQCGSRAAGINVKSPHRREALKFLQYLASPAYSRLIVADGDSMPPNPELARSGQDLVNEAVDDPEFHEPFVEALKSARPLDYSPYIDASLVQRWLSERIGQVENKLVSPEEAMRSLAAEINEKIRQNIERRPDLQALSSRR